MDLRENLSRVKERIFRSASRAGRNPDEITLIAVSKTVDSSTITQMIKCGHSIFGENRPQILRDKSKELAHEKISWHMIGNLQKNKIKYVYPLVELVHSIDNIELIDEFIHFAEKTGKICPCLLEVHISDENSKQGFHPAEILEIVASTNEKKNLDIRGFMGMAPFTDDETAVRGAFRKLRNLFDESKKIQSCSYKPEILSMGMSDDFEIAIEEGSTMVRIGRALFS
ncbi:MAG: YggS family pyridoxal phosphate-dependent enzyme [Candidatus Riflebacteria bacterium]|nr:YggS family pyridoxal phosphate-dependent enzyme [Candidatus Riflebacteria bacterium]